jgi:hypothetical protein
MNSATISSVVELILKSGFTLAGVIVALIGLLAWHRTRSSHMIMARLWLLFNGNKECKVDYIKNFLEGQSAVLQFRFMTGLRRARTAPQIENLITWTIANNEDMADVAACRRYFDLEKPAPLSRDKLPSKLVMGLTWTAAMVLALGIVLCLGCVIFNRAILTMKDSKTVFTLTEHFAEPIGDGLAIQLKDCSVLLAQKETSGFTKSDIEHLCKWAALPETNEFIADTIQTQRLLSALLALYLGYFFIPAYRSIKSHWKVTQMLGRLERRARP